MEQSYIVVAVSGGVDSVVLLDSLVNQRLSEFGYQLLTTNSQLIVAHVDHGIREESGEDATFVQKLAKKYGLPFENYQAHLGTGASESAAREVRYKFLRQVCKKHNASVIITAHHQDDLIETAIINIMRGSGWRGLAAMQQISGIRYHKSNVTILRPLLGVTKLHILAYAKKHNLQWHEDSTNLDQNYLRNYIRHSLLPHAKTIDPDLNKKMLKLIRDTQSLRSNIESELEGITSMYKVATTQYSIPRYLLVMWPKNVAAEVIYTVFRKLDPGWHPAQNHILAVLHFCKAALPGKYYAASKKLRVTASGRMLSFELTDSISVVK